MSEKQKIVNRVVGIAMLLTSLFYMSYPFISQHSKEAMYLDGCIFKTVTNIPCPGCGYDRALNAAVQLNWHDAFHYHALFPFLIALSLFFVVIGIKMAFSGKMFTVSKTALYTILALVIISWVLKFIIGPAWY